MPDLVSMGECMIEFFADHPLSEEGVFYGTFAGDALNMLVAASRLGTSTGFITRVGDDPFRDMLLKGWQREGVDTSHAKVVKGFNGIYFIAIRPDGDREFTYYRKGSAPSTMVPEDLDANYIGAARVFHTSGITQAISETSRRTALQAVRMAREKGVMVSFDPNLRPILWPSLDEARRALEEVLPYVDIFLPSSQDASRMLGLEDPEELVRSLWRQGVRIVAIKMGDQGCLVGAGGRIEEVPAFKVEQVVDTSGAGDAFNGAFLHGIISGLAPRDAARLGVIMAGLKVRGRGAIASMPRREEVYSHFSRRP